MFAKLILNDSDTETVFELTYEEIVEIFKEFSTDKLQSRFTGNEEFKNAMKKAKEIWNYIPKSSY